MTARSVFITGGTGYLGRPLITELLARGHSVRALARAGSERRLPPGPDVVTGNALDDATFATSVAPADTFVHLVGTPHPNPSKAQQFRDVDLVSVRAAVAAAAHAWVKHFIYLSVAYPAPIMHEYIAVRKEGEGMIRASGMPATFLRPFYVLGPGHWWPYPLVPLFALMQQIPATRDGAVRLGPVTLGQMIRTLIHAVEHPPREGVRALNAPEIRRGGTA
ncbi:MAG: SDR family oxidoreductase [Gemmatimonadales bacterium]